MDTGEINIFVLTTDPVATFERAEPLLVSTSLLNKVVVAYREMSSDAFMVIWPKCSTEAFVIA
jgi:hypothetical protein